MEDTSAASAGFVLAGVALVAAFLPWPGEPTALGAVGELASPIAAVVAGLALVAFGLRRHGLLARRPGATLAGVASLLVVGYGLAALYRPVLAGLSAPSPGLGLVLSLSAGLGAVGMAFADGTGEGRDSLLSKVASTLTGLFVGLLGLIVGTVLAFLVSLALGVEDIATQIAVLTVSFGVGLAIVGIGYVVATERGLEYLDFEVPSLRDLGVTILGVVTIFGMLYVASIVIASLGLPTTDNSITEPAQEGNVGTLLVLIPLSWLVIGPSEELLYRNVVQKSLYESFSKWGALAVGSGVFAIAHFPAYYNPNVIATVTTLVIVFLLSLILGATYVLTDNVTVPALVHGTFDAVLFAALYVTLSGDVPTEMVVWLPEAMLLLLP